MYLFFQAASVGLNYTSHEHFHLLLLQTGMGSTSVKLTYTVHLKRSGNNQPITSFRSL